MIYFTHFLPKVSIHSYLAPCFLVEHPAWQLTCIIATVQIAVN